MAKASKKVEAARDEGRDPDIIVSMRVGEALSKELSRRGISLGKAECSALSLAIIIEFLQARAFEWGNAEKIREIGEPDAETVGFAEAMLPDIGGKLAELDFPFEKPMNDLSKEGMSYLFAVGYLAIHEQKVSCFERNGPLPMEGLPIDDDEIPF
jgi:hypothetical protein